MRTGTRPRAKGFWKGLAAGLVLAGIMAVGLALIFPPVRYMAPEVSGAVIVAPDGVAGPGFAKGVRAPAGGGLLVAPPAPLIVERPRKILPPEAPDKSRPVAQEPGGGASSLVPLAGQ